MRGSKPAFWAMELGPGAGDYRSKKHPLEEKCMNCKTNSESVFQAPQQEATLAEGRRGGGALSQRQLPSTCRPWARGCPLSGSAIAPPACCRYRQDTLGAGFWRRRPRLAICPSGSSEDAQLGNPLKAHGSGVQCAQLRAPH